MTGSGISVTRLLGLVLVPAVIVGLMLWGLWNPTERLGTVRAAVVNLDEPVDIDGQLTPLGRVLAAELIGNDTKENFEWILTDEADAARGLDSGAYITVVTIPETFSEAATSLGAGPATAEQARIHIATSERAMLLDAALATAVTETATRLINEQLGSAVITNIATGMSSLGDGVDQVSDGATDLSEGLGELADGVTEFAIGTEALAGGVSELAAGSNQLAQGLQEYATGVDEFAAGAGAAAAGSRELAGGIQQYTDTINSILVPIHDGLAGQLENLERLRSLIENEDLPITDEQRAQILGAIDEVIAAPAGINQLIGGGRDLAAGAWAQAGGLDELAAGANDLASGAHGIAGGAGELSHGTNMLASEIPALVTGAHQLAEGTSQVSDGSRDLAEGLGLIAEEIPRYTDAEAERFAELALQPVSSGDDDRSLFTGTGAPLFLTVALWAGALAAFLLLPPLWSRTRVAARSEAWITIRSGWRAVLTGGLQGVIAGALVAGMLSTSWGPAVAFLTFGALAGAAFGLVNQGLVALLKGPGRFVSFALLVAALVAGIVSTVPGVFATVVSFTPIGTGIEGVQRIIETGTPGTGPTILMVLWAGLGVILLGAAVHRTRKTLT